MQNFITNYIADSIKTKEKILNNEDFIEEINLITEKVIAAYKNGKKLLIAGNGGSAADAQHIACEFVSKFYFDRQGLPAQALTINTSTITAIGNDYGFKKLFARQIQAQGEKGDIFIAISTSGNSENIIEAINEAKEQGIVTIGFTGEKPCKMDKICDNILKVPSQETPKIQESHIMLGHIICAACEKALFNNN